MSFFSIRNLYDFLLKTSLPFVIKHICYYFTQQLFGKRTSLFISLKKGALTVEATVIFPLFLAACISVLFFAELFRLEVKVDEALFNCAKVYAQYGGLLDKGETEYNVLPAVGINGIGIYAAGRFVTDELGNDYLNDSILANGEKSFSFIHSSISSEYIDLIVTYKVKFDVPFFDLPQIPIVQRCRIHTWSGKSEKDKIEGQEDEIVYVTKKGTVYHKNLECTYIKFQIEKISFSDVSSRRNSSGGKYYACERCMKNVDACTEVYITKNGTRYHNSVSCSELKRTISEIKLSEARNKYRPCNRCVD